MHILYTRIEEKTRKMHCILCEMPLGKKVVVQGANNFCCHGCLSVYNILEARNENNKKEHPLFHQALRYGIISNPELVQRFQNSVHKKRITFEVQEMWCPSCAELISLVLSQLRGVVTCRVDYFTDLAFVEYDPLTLSKEQIYACITSLGYQIQELDDPQAKQQSSYLNFRFGVAAFAALNVMMFAYPVYAAYFEKDTFQFTPLLAWVSLGFTLPVLLYSAAPIYRRMFHQLKHGIFGMETLVGVGTLSAFLLSMWEIMRGTYHIYFDTIAVLIAFILLGKIIENKTKFSSKAALIRLHYALPRKARRPDGTFIPIKEVAIGEILTAFTGERIVLDGKVIKGEGACDESVLTGEAMPILKTVGSTLLAGSILQKGMLTYQVSAKANESTLHRILTLIEQEIGHKSIYTSYLDAILKWFAPIVVMLALSLPLLAILSQTNLEEALRNALAVLLIACPCAIGIAAPLIESQLVHLFAEKGALLKNRNLLRLLPQVTHWVFDKTGTITEGKFKVLSGLEEIREKGILKGLVSQSLHPIAQAIHNALDGEATALADVQEVIGKGILGQMWGEVWGLGSASFLQERGYTATPKGKFTTVYFFSNRQIYPILLGDKIKPDAPRLLEQLSPFRRILLSGDHLSTVQDVATQLNFDHYAAEMNPLQKQQYILQLKAKGHIVAMLGDGINDAPALASADVGISVVTATDISLQVSDLLITTPNLNLIPELMHLTKKGHRLIQQNLFWAFAYNILGLALAACGLLTPLFASFAMIISSVFVVFNSKRL